MISVRQTTRPVPLESVIAAILLSLTLLCTTSGCLPAFGGSDEESAEAEGAESASEESSDETDAGTDSEEARAAEAAEAEKQSEINEAAAARDSRSIDDLLEAIKVALKETKNEKPPKKKSARENWQVAQQSHIGDGVLAATVLAVHNNSSEGQKRHAWKSKAILLYRAAEHGWPAFTDRLAQTAEQMKTDTDFEEEAEYASGLLVVHQCYDQKTKVHEAIEVLTAHAQAFPQGDTSAKLFLGFVKRLEKQGKHDLAEKCCQAALWPLNNHPEVASVRSHLESLQARSQLAMANQSHIAPSVRQVRSGSRDAVQIELEKQVSAIRGMLPMKVDAATTLTNITPGYHTINYSYTVTLSKAQMERAKDDIRRKVTKLARSISATREILEAGVTMNYAYYDRSGNRLLSFSVSKRS